MSSRTDAATDSDHCDTLPGHPCHRPLHRRAGTFARRQNDTGNKSPGSAIGLADTGAPSPTGGLQSDGARPASSLRLHSRLFSVPVAAVQSATAPPHEDDSRPHGDATGNDSSEDAVRLHPAMTDKRSQTMNLLSSRDNDIAKCCSHLFSRSPQHGLTRIAVLQCISLSLARSVSCITNNTRSGSARPCSQSYEMEDPRVHACFEFILLCRRQTRPRS